MSWSEEKQKRNEYQDIIENNNTVKGVKYKDKDIVNINDDEKPINLGFDGMDKDMEGILLKPPGHAIYRNVKEIDVELDIEEAFTKLRWNKVNNQENDKDTISVDKKEDVKCYDPINEVLDFQQMKATDMKCNKRVYMVDPSDIEMETKCENLKIEMMKSFKVWSNTNKETANCNLNDNDKRGMTKVMDSVKEKKAVVFPTNKSKKFYISTPDE